MKDLLFGQSISPLRLMNKGCSWADRNCCWQQINPRLAILTIGC